MQHLISKILKAIKNEIYQIWQVFSEMIKPVEKRVLKFISIPYRRYTKLPSPKFQA